MARRRKHHVAQMGLDSFVDIVANTLGIIILLVMVSLPTLQQGMINLTMAARQLKQIKAVLGEKMAYYETLRDQIPDNVWDDIKRFDKINKELVRIQAENLPKQEEMRLVKNAAGKAAAAETALKDTRQTAEVQRLEKQKKNKKLTELARNREAYMVRVPRSILSKLKAGQKPGPIADSLKKRAELSRTALDKLDKELNALLQRKSQVEESKLKKEVADFRQLLKQQENEYNRLLAEVERLQYEYDEFRENSDQLAFVHPRRDVRARKIKRLVFECAPEGVLFLYETDGRKLKCNANDYRWPAEHRFPMMVARTGSGEDAVRIWKGMNGEAKPSTFEKQLRLFEPGDYDLVFIVRSNTKSYRNFRRARHLAEDVLGYIAQWELVPSGDTLTLSRPPRFGAGLNPEMAIEHPGNRAGDSESSGDRSAADNNDDPYILAYTVQPAE